MPVQRLLKYPLFFRELLELVAQVHPARDITLTLTPSPLNLHHSSLTTQPLPYPSQAHPARDMLEKAARLMFDISTSVNEQMGSGTSSLMPLPQP